MQLSDKDIDRYSRNIILPEIGGEGQYKLLQSKVLVIGMGGLGSPLLMYLAAAGIGNITIIDNDNVELSNLQRQVIHGTHNIGRPKVDSAKSFIEKINPSNPNQYEVDGEWRDMDRITEIIEVAGAEPIVIKVRSTHHGPIVSDRSYPVNLNPEEDQVSFADEARIELPDNFSVSLWFKSSANDFPLVNWTSPNFNLEVQEIIENKGQK